MEFKNLYTMENNVLYSIAGSPISIPSKYKTRDADGNLVLDKGLFKEYPESFQKSGGKIIIAENTYSLKQKVIQPQSAVVISDPFNGGIKAMVGGRNTVGRLLYNRAISPRQPGSSIKPIAVYGPALQAGLEAAATNSVMNFKDSSGIATLMGDYFTLASVIDDTPMTVNGKQWPKNWYPGFRGLYTLRGALEQSANVPAVRVFQQLGVHRSLAFLKKLEISSIVENGPANDLNAAALALGGMTNGVSPLEMSAAYAAFVNDGKYTEPVSFTKIVNRKGSKISHRNGFGCCIFDARCAENHRNKRCCESCSSSKSTCCRKNRYYKRQLRYLVCRPYTTVLRCCLDWKRCELRAESRKPCSRKALE